MHLRDGEKGKGGWTRETEMKRHKKREPDQERQRDRDTERDEKAWRRLLPMQRKRKDT